MRLKVFQAPNMGAAMTLVRDELGPDALILSTQTIDGGVEVTAAQDPENPTPPLADATHQIDLEWHGIRSPLAERLSGDDLVVALRSEFRFSSLPCAPAAPPLLLVGAPGAGKTMSAARIATRMRLAGHDPLVITADGRRAGAAEQLAAFTRLLSLTLIVANSPQQLHKAMTRRQNNAPVVIDMPGLNPHDPADQYFLTECKAATAGSLAVVLPAGLDPDDAAELAQGFKDLGANLLIATRLDQSRRLGGILTAASVGLALTDAGTGAGVADGFTSFTPEFLAERLCIKRSQKTPSPTPAPKPLSGLAMLARPKIEPMRSDP